MPILVHTMLIALHILTVAVGLGAALLADWVAFRLLFAGAITSTATAKLRDLSQAVTTGVVLLWMSGGALVWFDTIADASFLLNQKVWAKVVIVALLSLNAILLHKIVLPLVSAQIGRTLFEGTDWIRKSCCTFAASMSLVSWLSALLLGVARELNGVVTVGQVLMAYATVLGFAWFSSMTTVVIVPLVSHTQNSLSD